MKKVYDLETALANDPQRVADAQELTLDAARSSFGLAGEYGLYGSDEWWQNLHAGKLPLTTYEGVIETIQFSGMHNESKSFTLSLAGGGRYNYTCIADQKSDVKLYAPGRKVRVIAFTERMKSGSEMEFVWSIEIENC